MSQQPSPLTCAKADRAIQTLNQLPNDQARLFCAQWYRDILSLSGDEHSTRVLRVADEHISQMQSQITTLNQPNP